MKFRHVFSCLVLALAVFGAGMPAQAAMVPTEQLQNDVFAAKFADISRQRDWIETQLLRGGVDQADASTRVAAMTDAEVAQIYQRIDEAPAGGSDLLLIALVVFLVLELTGYIDVIPDK
jgi:hypothetical protein